MAEALIPPIGQNMEACRRELGISAAAAARAIGVEPLTFYRWRNGDVIPRWEHVVAAGELFRKTPDWFYAEHEHEDVAA